MFEVMTDVLLGKEGELLGGGIVPAKLKAQVHEGE